MNSALVLPFPASRGMKLLIGCDPVTDSVTDSVTGSVTDSVTDPVTAFSAAAVAAAVADTAPASSKLLVRVPNRNGLLTEMHRLHAAYGGVFAMNLTQFIETHECVPLFMEPEELLTLSLHQRILILIPFAPGPSNMVQKMYETFRRDLPLFMFDLEFYLMFVRAVLVLEYSRS
jgi:hypothetical protein